jgi:MFS family permease
MILGGPLFGYFGDKFGRRAVVASILFTSSIIGGGVFLFRSYTVYVVLRFTLGCLMQVMLLSSLKNLLKIHNRCFKNNYY